MYIAINISHPDSKGVTTTTHTDSINLKFISILFGRVQFFQWLDSLYYLLPQSRHTNPVTKISRLVFSWGIVIQVNGRLLDRQYFFYPRIPY